MRASLLPLALCISAGGCPKSRPDYDRSSPAKTLEALVEAFDRGRIPADLEVFFAREADVAAWRDRCQDHRCRGATIRVVNDRGGNERAVRLSADVRIRGRQGETVVARPEASILMVRGDDGGWRIQQLNMSPRLPTKTIKLPGHGSPPGPPVDGGP